MEEGVTFGPLINKAPDKSKHMLLMQQKAQSHFRRARHDLGGTFYQPTILTEVTSDMMITRGKPLACSTSLSIYR